MKAVNIQWDIDEDNKNISLPNEINIPKNITSTEEISDYITNQTGFCHKGFEIIMSLKDYERQSKTLVKNRTIVDNLGLSGKQFYIWNPEFDVPLCYDGKALTFTTREYAEQLAASHLTKDQYTIVHKKFLYKQGHIHADGLIIKRVEEKDKNGAWHCQDLLAEKTGV